MDELAQKIAEASNRILALQTQKDAAYASAKAHEAEAKAAWQTYWDAKKEIGQLETVLRHAGVQQAADNAAAAAQQAQAKAEEHQKTAEQTLARLAEKEAQLDELLKASAKPADAQAS